MNSKIELSQIELTREQVRRALPHATDKKMREALSASMQILDALLVAPKVDRSSKYAGSIHYTFEDEPYEPFGREVDVRVYYSWYDYDAADEPSPVWGATVDDLEVLAVRHFDKDGNELDQAEHDLDIAWHFLNNQHEEVTEACTEDRCHNGAGTAPIANTPIRSSFKVAAEAAPSPAPRMAPSSTTRKAQQDRRELG